MVSKPLTVLAVNQLHRMRGGAERVFIETAKLLQSRGHEVIPFAGQDSENLPTPWERYFPVTADFDRPGPLDVMRYLYSRPAARAIRRLLRARRPDVAHLHIYYGKLTASILGPLRRAGVPIVQTLHEYKLICPVYTLWSQGQICEACEGRRFYRALPRRCNRGSLPRTALSVLEATVSRALGNVRGVEHFVAVSDFVRRKVIEHGLPADRVSTVYNFVDTASIPVCDSPGEHLLYFGRLEPVKGLQTLLDAAAPLRELPLILAGTGPMQTELQRQIEARRLNHIRLVGYQSGQALRELISRSRCVLVPSLWHEPCPMSVLEALAHGRPVLASDAGGLPELVTDGVTGWVVPRGDVEALREKMRLLIEQPEQARELGRAGRASAETRFHPDVFYDRMMTVLRSVL